MVTRNGSFGNRIRAAARTRPVRLVGRAVRYALVVVMWALVGVALLVGALLESGAVRSRLLNVGLATVRDDVPGELALGRAEWPALGRLHLSDLVWTSGAAPPDTLLHLADLVVQIDMAALRHRDVRIDTLRADISVVDGPALESLLAGRDTTDAVTAPTDSTAAPAAVLRAGSIPGVPSVGLGHLGLSVGRARLTPDLAVSDFVFSGRFEAGYGRPGGLILDHVAGDLHAAVLDSLAGHPWPVSLAHLGLGLTLPDSSATEPGQLGPSAATLDSLTVRFPHAIPAATAPDIHLSVPLHLRNSGAVRRADGGVAGHLICDFVLPGPGDVATLLPAALPVGGFGQVAGRLRIEVSYDRSQLEASCNLDLDRTAWLQEGRVQAAFAGDLPALVGGDRGVVTVDLDTLAFALDGASLRAGGRYHEGLASFRLHGAVTDSTLPTSVVALIPEGAARRVAGDILGEVRLEVDYLEPALDARVDLDLGRTDWMHEGRLRADLAADLPALLAGDLRTARVQLDTLALVIGGTAVQAAGTYGDAEIDLDLRASVADTRLVALLAPDVAAELDTSEVWLQADLSAQGPLQSPEVALALAGRVVGPKLELPELRASLQLGERGGECEVRMPLGFAAGEAAFDSLATSVQVGRFASDSLSADFRFGAWSGSRYIVFGGRALVDSLGRAPVRTVQLDSLILTGAGQSLRLRETATITQGPEPGGLNLTPFVLEGEPGTLAVAGSLSETIDLTCEVDLLLRESTLMAFVPLELWTQDGGFDLALDADVRLGGTRMDPNLGGGAGLRLIPHRGEVAQGLDFDFALASGDSAGVIAKVAFVTADTAALEATLVVPGRIEPETGRWISPPDDPIRLDVPEQRLGLERLNRLLPPSVGLEGDLKVGAQVRAAPVAATDSTAARLEGTVEGRVVGPQLEVRLPNRSRIELVTDITVDGPLTDPHVGGKIEVTSGFFRIPELPRSLLPTDGEPLLWQMAPTDTLDSFADTVQVFVRPEAVGPGLTRTGPQVLPELDLTVVVPRNLRIHGYGLNIELAGDMHIGRGYDEDGLPQPKITGDVRVVEGTLQFMNRVFRVQRGEIVFHGAVPPDPVLDMLLETDVSGTRVRILVAGTASDPRVTLSSEPEYEEQDIVAVLLFGSPLSELDDDQRGGVRGEDDAGQQLRQNLAGLAMVFGTAGLQNSMSETFGVDMVEVGSGSAGDSTLMVGKFIAPNLILKYNQSLEKSGTYFLTMEYALSQMFKLVSTYGQGEEDSGIEVKWNKRF